MQAGDREKVGLQGLEVTRLGLGGTTFGNLYSALDEQEGLDVIDASYMAGVRYFDTAPFYGHGLSEHRLGAAAVDGHGRDGVEEVAGDFVEGLELHQEWLGDRETPPCDR